MRKSRTKIKINDFQGSKTTFNFQQKIVLPCISLAHDSWVMTSFRFLNLIFLWGQRFSLGGFEHRKISIMKILVKNLFFNRHKNLFQISLLVCFRANPKTETEFQNNLFDGSRKRYLLTAQKCQVSSLISIWQLISI